MRSLLLTSLLTSASLASASRLECVRAESRELALAASCGHQGSLNHCFSSLPPTTQPEALDGELWRCFEAAGCTPAEARIEAAWVLKRCDGASSDLRRGRRQLAPDADGGPGSLGSAAKEPLLGARDALPAGVTAMLLPRQTTDTAAAETVITATDTNASPSPCFTDTTTSITTCPLQTTGTAAGKKLSCFPTVMTSAVCREGLICQSDNQGNPSCMYKHSSLGVDGTVIAIVFASAIAISVVSICVLCCRERRAHRRVERAAEAARIAKEAKTQATVASKRPGASVTAAAAGASPAAVEGQPLMYQVGGGGAAPGTASPGAQQQQHQQQQQQYFPQQPGYGAANPFADVAHDGHPLR